MNYRHEMKGVVVLAAIALSAWGQTGPDPKAGLHSVALTTLGATATGRGAPWNKDWPAINALRPTPGGGGALFGAPMTGAELEIRLIVPVDIRGIELFPLNYRGTRQISQAEIYIDGEKVLTVDLPHAPGQGHFFPLDGRVGRTVMVKVTGEHPLEELPDGNKGPAWGGWSRIRVYSSTDVAAMMAIPKEYQVERHEDAIAPTSGAFAQGVPVVHGTPRIAAEHPKTIWDREDIARYKGLLETDPPFRRQFEGLRAAMEARITKPLGVPEPRQDAQGNWVHLPNDEVAAVHNALALDICNLGIVYALTDDPKYAEYAKRLLLAYAEAYPRYGVGARPGFNHDPSRLFDQRLSDATWQIQVVRGYDLIYTSPMTGEERRKIEDDLLKASARFIAANSAHLRAPTNWSAFGTAAIFITGVATDDPELTDLGLFGLNAKGHPKKWWEGESNPNPTGMELHFSPQCIRDDGLWGEGAMGYQFMALQAMVVYAEVMWRRGVNLYAYRDGALKRLFDSPLEFAYPDLRTPAINDSGYGSLTGYDAYLYEYAYLRYRDPKYVVILKQTGRRIGATFQQFTPSVLYGVDLEAETKPVEWRSVNFFDVGYGILRNTSERGTVSLLLDYGKSGSHDHPDKLNLDLWGFGDRLLPDPGSIWYEQPLYRNWYATTVAHNALVVDELNQEMGGGVVPRQLVYLPAVSHGIQRAHDQTAYSGVMMDRAVFVTPEYTADLFGAFGGLPRRLDLAWHPNGELTEMHGVELADFAFSAPIERGYSELDEPRAARTAGPYAIVVRGAKTPIRLIAAGGAETEVIVAKGHLGTDRPPTVLQRRTTDLSLWANAVDYSADGVVRAVRQEGSLKEGFALAEIEKANGADICFVSYRPGRYRRGDFETDAQQVFVAREGGHVTAALLGGGTHLRAGAVELRRDTLGLAFVERSFTGTWMVGNSSPSPAEITVRLPGAGGMSAYTIDADGRRLGDADTRREGDAVTMAMAPMARVELAAAGTASMYDARQELLRRQMEAREAEERARREAIARRSAQRTEDAKRFAVPPNTLRIVNAMAFVGEGGGQVRRASNKRGIVGDAFLGWDAVGHWLEYAFDVPAEGYYHLALVYCTEQEGAERQIAVNGEPVEPEANLVLPSTGGYSNNSDDWRLYVASDPADGRPLLIKLRAGRNVIRLTNVNGRSANVNYLAVFSPDMTVTRERLAQALEQEK